MLPGFRFLFAAIVLSMSILVFGLGAAALLRAAHEEFANLPSRRVSPEPQFSRQIEPPTPTLALLRFDPPVAEKASDNDAATAAPEIAIPDVTASEAAAPVAQAPDPAPPEPDKLAALSSEATAPAEVVKPEIPATEPTVVTQVTPTEANAPVVADDAVKVAAVAEAPEPSITVASAAPDEPAADVPSPAASPAATRIATLGGPAVSINDLGERTSLKASQAKADRSAVRKRMSQRAKERRRIARRARLAREAALAAQQQQPNPFGQLPIVRGTQ